MGRALANIITPIEKHCMYEMCVYVFNLLMMLYAHADGVDEDGHHDSSVEVFALHDAPQFDPHLHPQLSAPPPTCPLHPLAPVRLLGCILLCLLIGC